MEKTTDTNKKRVLIVDNDEGLRTVLKDKLDLSGFETITAADGQEGVEKALATHPDIILLDIMMPKMTGWQALDKLRQDPWGKMVKIIMLTVLEDMSNVAQAMEKNSVGYVVKTNKSLDSIVDQVRQTLAK